ncbi:MAG: biotin--[acetyl-CoA-carboxylase] ligase [Gammaproteobacteria bacterium]|nr:biotin--[acetyl-CoA-carboxylase] ligase [Gammaproteobacteria bacterium]
MASTNCVSCWSSCPPAQTHGQVRLAEYQSAGQGRHGNSWLSPLAGGLYLSIGWRADGMAEPLTGLSLAAGVAAVRALASCGIDGVRLKWPNDLVAANGKLGGILLQVRGEITGACLWVLGIGINVRLPATMKDAIEQPVTDLASLTGAVPARSELAAALINELVRCLAGYPLTGFRPYVNDWQRYDCMSGRRVTLSAGSRVIHGRMLGVDSGGALLMSIDGAVQRYASGELSLRAAP